MRCVWRRVRRPLRRSSRGTRSRSIGIGLGGQGCFHLNEGLCKNNDIHVAAFSDVYAASQKSARPLVMLSNAKQYLKEGEPVTDEMKAAAKALPAPRSSA